MQLLIPTGANLGMEAIVLLDNLCYVKQVQIFLLRRQFSYFDLNLFSASNPGPQYLEKRLRMAIFAVWRKEVI